MNKKVLFVSILAVGMLVGCGDNKKPTQEIGYKDAITKISEHKEEINTYDRIGVTSTMEKSKIESKTISGTKTETFSVSTTNAKEELKVAGLVSATKASELSASLSASVGSVTINDGKDKKEGKDMAVKAYLNNSNLYVDLSNKGLKDFAGMINGEPVLEEDPDKLYLPLTMDDAAFPLLKEDMFTQEETPNIEDLMDPSVIGDLVGGMDIDPEQMAQMIQMASTMMNAIDINDYVKVKSSKDYSDFSFTVELTKDNLVKGVESAMKAMFASMVPADTPLTAEDKAALDAQVASYVAMVKTALETGGFDHIKFNLEMRDYLITELSYDVKAGFAIPSTPTFDDVDTPVVPETSIISIETKGNVKISYGDKVKVDTLKDFSDFKDPLIEMPDSTIPGGNTEGASTSISD